jgi:copper(I)-binding protein
MLEFYLRPTASRWLRQFVACFRPCRWSSLSGILKHSHPGDIMIVARPLIALGLALLTLPALADTVKIDHAWIRATAPGQNVAGAFMDLTADSNMTLVGAESDAAKTVQLHTMSMDNGTMVMRQVKEIPLNKGETVSLKPGSLHIMLIDLNGQIKEGDKTAITLVVRNASGKEQKIPVEVEAHAMGGMMMKQPMAH